MEIYAIRPSGAQSSLWNTLTPEEKDLLIQLYPASFPLIEMDVDQTADKGFTAKMVEDHESACVVSDSGEVGRGSDGNIMFGKVVYVNDSTAATKCFVASKGVVRLATAATVPTDGQAVCVDGAGKIKVHPLISTLPEGQHGPKGLVIKSITGFADVDLY